MTNSDPITSALMAKGAPFEVVSADVGGRTLRVFKNAAQTLPAVFDRARSFGDNEFIVFGQIRLTFNAFFKRADNLAGYLQTKIKLGQSVGICMKNCPEWMIAFVAILNAGGVAVLMNSRGKSDALAAAANDADCVLVLADGKRLESLRKAGYQLPVLRRREFKDVGDYKYVPIRRGSDETAAMFFTSGTTGRAKAAAISHRALVTGTMNTELAIAAIFEKMAAVHNMDVETMRSQMPQPCSLLVFPLFHTAGCSAVFLTAMTIGGKLALMDRWSGEACVELIAQEKITSFGGVPTMHWDMLRASNFGGHDLSSLMTLSCGGQALPLGLLDEIRAAFPEAILGSGYGMTETSGAISQATGEAFVSNPSASGMVLPMMDVRIVGDEGQDVEPGEVGEIWVRGATVMQGYYGRPEDTANSFSGDWFMTGDVGRIDEDGYIYIVDRKTDMVICGGENVYCAEVELSLGRHADVLDITSFGVPDDRLGERLIASVVSKSGALTPEDLIIFAKQHLANYKIPSEIIISPMPFNLNAMGKVDKNKVREAYLTELKTKENSYAVS